MHLWVFKIPGSIRVWTYVTDCWSFKGWFMAMDRLIFGVPGKVLIYFILEIGESRICSFLWELYVFIYLEDCDWVCQLKFELYFPSKVKVHNLCLKVHRLDCHCHRFVTYGYFIIIIIEVAELVTFSVVISVLVSWIWKWAYWGVKSEEWGQNIFTQFFSYKHAALGFAN